MKMNKKVDICIIFLILTSVAFLLEVKVTEAYDFTFNFDDGTFQTWVPTTEYVEDYAGKRYSNVSVTNGIVILNNTIETLTGNYFVSVSSSLLRTFVFKERVVTLQFKFNGYLTVYIDTYPVSPLGTKYLSFSSATWKTEFINLTDYIDSIYTTTQNYQLNVRFTAYISSFVDKTAIEIPSSSITLLDDIQITNVSMFAGYKVGVLKGDKWSYIATDINNDTIMFDFEITSVNGFNVMYDVRLYKDNNLISSNQGSITIDRVDAITFPTILISSELVGGDFLGKYTDLKVNYTTQKEYLGSVRTVNVVNYAGISAIYDKHTGVLLELISPYFFDVQISSEGAKIKMQSLALWQEEQGIYITNLHFVILLIIAFIVLLIFIKKKKKRI